MGRSVSHRFLTGKLISLNLNPQALKMPSADLDIEILTIDDSAPPVKTVLNKTKNPLKKKWRTVRKSTGVGGKAPHATIPFKPLRKTVAVKPPSPKKSKSVNPEYFDVEDDEDSDNEIQVIENDPLDDIEVVSDGEMFCDMCGLFLETAKDMENHHESAHQLVTCKWCQIRLGISEIKNHIGSKLCPTFTKVSGSHCSVHAQMETDSHLEMEDFRNCRPLRCDACSQRYDGKSLKDFKEEDKNYICPGCLHGRILLPDSEVAKADVEKSEDEEPGAENHPNSKAGRPVPQFLSTPNPIPLPEILLLDDEVDNSKKADASKDEDGADCTASKSDKSESEASVKSGGGSLTSELVDLINTELQGKAIAKIPISDSNTIEKESNRNLEEKTNNVEIEEIVCLDTEPCKEIDNGNEKQAMEIDIVEIVEVSDTFNQKEAFDSLVTEGGPSNDVIKTLNMVIDKEVLEECNSPAVEESSSDDVIEILNTEITKAVSSMEAIEDVENEVVLSSENGSNAENKDVSATITMVRVEPSNAESTNICEAVSDEIVSSVEIYPTSQTPSKEQDVTPVKSQEVSSPDLEVSSIPSTARRVARKSTKPPQRPQRTSENINELLLFENFNTDSMSSPSPKRKLSPPTSARKVARKSSRRPVNPQRTLFGCEVESQTEVGKETGNVGDVISNDDSDAALLQATPEKSLQVDTLDGVEV